jgi:DNA-binding NarL/FixJ family response regulator
MIRVLVADDHTIMREGLKQLLVAAGDLDVVGEARDGHEVLQQVRALDFDVLLLDMSMPGKSGMDLIKQVKSEKPRLRILVLSMHQEHQYAVRAIKAGASGYLTKESASTLLVSAIRKSPAAAHSSARKSPSSWHSAPCRTAMDRRMGRFPIASTRYFYCSPQERPSPRSQPQLNLSDKTVSTHKARLLEKLNIGNQTELVHYALRHRLIDGSDAPA